MAFEFKSIVRHFFSLKPSSILSEPTERSLNLTIFDKSSFSKKKKNKFSVAWTRPQSGKISGHTKFSGPCGFAGTKIHTLIAFWPKDITIQRGNSEKIENNPPRPFFFQTTKLWSIYCRGENNTASDGSLIIRFYRLYKSRRLLLLFESLLLLLSQNVYYYCSYWYHYYHTDYFYYHHNYHHHHHYYYHYY